MRSASRRRTGCLRIACLSAADRGRLGESDEPGVRRRADLAQPLRDVYSTRRRQPAGVDSLGHGRYRRPTERRRFRGVRRGADLRVHLGRTFKRANAGAAGTKGVLGLVIDAAIAVSATGRVQTAGLVTFTTAQWDSITGQTGGLTPGTLYYLDVTAGLLEDDRAGQRRRAAGGRRLSTTVLQLQIAGRGRSDVGGERRERATCGVSVSCLCRVDRQRRESSPTAGSVSAAPRRPCRCDLVDTISALSQRHFGRVTSVKDGHGISNAVSTLIGSHTSLRSRTPSRSNLTSA
jgi:hypothetical protein